MTDLIVVRQLPIIEEHLQAKKAEVEKLTAEAVSLVCTPETLTAVRERRTALIAEFNALEEQRKAVKAAILEPYNRFDGTYKECASTAYKTAIETLGAKIHATEQAIKSGCEEEMQGLFAELTAAHDIKWLTYDRMGLSITLTEAKQKKHPKLVQRITEFVTGVSDAVNSISTMEGADEILVEYKQSLSLSAAVSTVFERHRRIEEESEATEARRAAQEAQRAAIEKVEACLTAAQERPLQPPTEARTAVSKSEKIYQTVFTVHGTVSQLRTLKEFMKKEGIQYE